MSWGARSIYAGPGFQLPPHKNAVAVLAMSLGTPFRIARNSYDWSGGHWESHSVLIEPGRVHLLDSAARPCVFVYTDALSRDLLRIRARCDLVGDGLQLQAPTLQRLREAFDPLPTCRESWSEGCAQLEECLGLTPRGRDDRVAQVVEGLLANASDGRNAEAWASAVGLSSSRFQHVFKEHTGLSFRRFRIWARMRAAVAAAMRGASLTEAAIDSGLASSAHLSAAFKAMFGLSLSQLLQRSPKYYDLGPHNNSP